MAEEEQHSSKFKRKRKLLKVGDKFTFNGSCISRISADQYMLSSAGKLKDLPMPLTKAGALSVRAKMQYIATNFPPDISSCVQLLIGEIDKGV